ncbi:MAG: hypothetical protein ACI4DV_06985 [Lachnospiraceae bacterium]
MGVVKICERECTAIPFYAKLTGINLYSIEELSYYLYENIYLADQTIIGEDLYVWLEQEAGYAQLAEKLRADEKAGCTVYDQAVTILQVSEYYSAEQMEELSSTIRMMSGMQEQERLKFKADELFENGNIWAAVSEYERILSIRQNLKLPVEFYGKIWNNLGCCYARLFLFKKAAACFDMAYQFQKSMEYKKLAVCARKLAQTNDSESEDLMMDEEYKKLVELTKEELRRIQKRSLEKMSDSDRNALLRKWERNYRKVSRI